jgi:hypothetical protein
MMRTTTRTVQRALSELVALDAVEVTAVRWGNRNMLRRNLYTVHMDPPRAYRGSCSITSWGVKDAQVGPVTTSVSSPDTTPVSQQPDELPHGEPEENANASGAASSSARRRPDRGDQRDLGEEIEDAMTTDRMGYEDAARSVLAEFLSNDGIDGGWVEGLIDEMLDRGDHPAKILNTARKQSEGMIG